MTKMLKKIMRSGTSLLLAASLIASSLGTTAFAASLSNVVGAGEDGVINYVSLGASQTNGYGLRYYLDEEVYENPAEFDKATANVYGYQRTPEGAYPYQVKKTLEKETGKAVELDQLAISSMRAEELHMLLDNEYYGDEYTAWRFYDENGNGWFAQAEEGGLSALRKAYQDAIANADLITVDIGVNNFGVYAINQLMSNHYGADVSKLLTEEQYELYREVKIMLRDMLVDEAGTENAAELQPLSDMADTFAYAAVGFMIHFDASMEKIYELNPDAKVVALSIPNMMYGTYATIDGLEEKLPLGDIYSLLVNVGNFYIAALSPYADSYNYASKGDDAYVETFLNEILTYNGEPSDLSQNMKDCFDVYDDDLHLKIRVPMILEAAGITDDEITEKALTAAYDVAAEIMKKAALQNTLDIEVMLGGTSSAEDTLMTYIEESVKNAVLSVANGEEYVFTVDESLFEDSALVTAAVMGVRFMIGNSFFAHPNENGHQEVKDSIIHALKENVMGKDVAFAEYYEATSFEYEPVEDSYYVSIGDGSVVGVGYTGYTKSNKGYQTAIANTFSYKLAEELGLEIKYDKKNIITDGSQYMQLGCDLFSAEALRYILDETYVPDEYVTDKLEKNLEKYREDYQNEIPKADLITVGLSNTGITAFMVEQIKKDYGVGEPYSVDWSRYVASEDMPHIETAVAEMKAMVLESGIDASMADTLVLAIQSYAYAYVSHLCNYAEVINILHEMNPDAEILLIGTYNPLEEIKLTLEGESFPLGDYVQYLVEMMNLHFMGYCMLSANATFVDAPDVETLLDADSSENAGEVDAITFVMNLIRNGCNDMYPNDNGHEYIKNQILGDKVVTYLLGDVNGDGDVNMKDVTGLYQYVQGITSLDDAALKRANVISYDDINMKDVTRLYQYVQGVAEEL